MRRAISHGIVFVISLLFVVSAFAQDAPSRLPENADQILLKEATASHDEEIATARARQKEAMSIAQDATEFLDKGDSLAEAWERDVVPLLNNEDGEYLTVQQEYVKAFSGYYNTERPTQRDIDRLREALNTFAEPLEAALAKPDSTYTPTPSLLGQLQQCKEKAASLVAGYDEPLRMIKALLARAQKDGKKGTDTLQAAMDQIAADTALKRGQELADRLEAKQEEAAKRIAEAQQQVIEDKAVLAEKAATQDAEIAKQQADKEALIKLAKSPDIQKRLAPFVTPGMSRIVANYIAKGQSGPAQPFSFGALNRARALEPTDVGRRTLVKFATSRANDRPTWPMPTTSEDWKRVQENQEYLRKLGPALVELGMLLP